MEDTIKWYKVKCSFYEQEFGIRCWRDVIDFMHRHVGFDIEIKGQATERFEGVDAYYQNNQFYKTK